MIGAELFNARNRNNLILVTAAVVVVSGLMAGPASDKWLKGWSNDVLHWLRYVVHQVHGTTEPSDVVIVTMTEAMEKTKVLGNTPRIFWLPIMGEVQDALIAAGAKVVSWDIVLPLPGGQWHKKKGYDKPILLSLLKNGRKKGKILIGRVQLPDRDLEPHKTYKRAIGGDPNIKLSNAFPDADNVVRSVVLRTILNENGEDKYVTSMIAETARRGAGKDWDFSDPEKLYFGGREVPQTRLGRMMLNMDPARPIPVFSYADLLDCDVKKSGEYLKKHFDGKVVFFGVDLQLEDRVTTPTRMYGSDNRIEMPSCLDESLELEIKYTHGIAGVFALANGVSNLMNETILWRPTDTFHFGAVLLVALGCGLAAVFLQPSQSIPIYLGIVVAVAGGFWWLFTHNHMVGPITEVLGSGTIVFGTFGMYRSIVLDKQRDEIRDMFSKYLDQSVIDEMISTGNVPKLGGETRWATLLFTDIAGYTDFSEPLKDQPETLVSIINRYFTVIGDIVENHRGYVVNYMGDAVMAMWGAPAPDEEQEKHAVDAVLECIEALEVFNRDVIVGELGLKPIGTRFGINSGLCLVGNSGSAKRLSFTATGDTVNTAARLESANKMYGTTFMIGEDTAAKIGDGYVLRQLDSLVVKGRTQALKVYEVVGAQGRVDEEKQAMVDRFHAALRLYHDREFDHALRAFESLAESDKAAQVYVERCGVYLENPPPDDWDGAFVATSK